MELDFIFEAERIYAQGKGNKILAEVTFHNAADGATMVIDHTFVDDSLRGQGIVGNLMEMAVDTIHRQGKKVSATCSYAVGWLEKHPQKV